MYPRETEDRIFGAHTPERIAGRVLSPIEKSRDDVLAEAGRVIDEYARLNPAQTMSSEVVNANIAEMERYFNPLRAVGPEPALVETNPAQTMSSEVVNANIAEMERLEKFDLSGLDTALSADATSKWLAELGSV